MAFATSADGTELFYEVRGRTDDPTMLMVTGFTAQLITWPNDLVDALTARGFRVVLFDNRDCGLSSKSSGTFDGAVELLLKAQAAQDVSGQSPYSLSDMANDAMAVLDQVGAGSAHIVGASMGGMIGQHLALEHPKRVRSLVSIMSTTGNSEVGAGDPMVLASLLTPGPLEREASIAHGVEVNRQISGPLWDRASAEERTAAGFDRSFHPDGASFQIAAMATSGDRTEQLTAVTAPTLVIHGREDKLIDFSAGLATAQAIPKSDLLLLGRMGHDLPEALWQQILDAIEHNTNRCPQPNQTAG